jgi:hypothetical protein
MLWPLLKKNTDDSKNACGINDWKVSVDRYLSEFFAGLGFY